MCVDPEVNLFDGFSHFVNQTINILFLLFLFREVTEFC